MEKHGIALIGFRGVGKSTVGRLLATRMGWSFLDMDALLVESFGRDISEWVGEHGWDAFREEESKFLARLSPQRKLVLATGGGVILRSENRKALKKNFFVAWLHATPETTLIRLREDPQSPGLRPALTNLPLKEEIERVLTERRPFYEESADLALQTDDASPTELTIRIHGEALKAGLDTPGS